MELNQRERAVEQLKTSSSQSARRKHQRIPVSVLTQGKKLILPGFHRRKETVIGKMV
jgi:hypothetical protein